MFILFVYLSLCRKDILASLTAYIDKAYGAIYQWVKSNVSYFNDNLPL